LFSFDLFSKEWHSVDQSGTSASAKCFDKIAPRSSAGQPPASRFGYVSVVHNNFFVVFGGKHS
jgi:hypothetical protein